VKRGCSAPSRCTSAAWAQGPMQGMLLSDLWADRGGNSPDGNVDTRSPFPLLIKVLDCQDLLSIQVHPNDPIAARLRPGELGKTEAWVILQADPGARIYAGLRPVSRAWNSSGISTQARWPTASTGSRRKRGSAFFCPPAWCMPWAEAC